MGIVRWSQLHRERNQVKAEIDRLIQKEGDLTGADMERSVKIIAGTARSMGIEVEK